MIAKLKPYLTSKRLLVCKDELLDELWVDTRQYDYIVCEPTPSNVRSVIGKCYLIGIPFAVLVPIKYTRLDCHKIPIVHWKPGVSVVLCLEEKKAWFTHNCSLDNDIIFA